MLDYMERMRETIDVLSDKEAVRKLNQALKRVESGEFLTKEEMVFDDV
jgi:PHD/YefM family antitoxin component YafN of YafNO toxin-antitoxin module